MSLKATYKGNEIAALAEDGEVTLKTGGTYCESDIVLANTQDGAAQTAASYDVESIDNGDGTQTIEILDRSGTIADGIIVRARDDDGDATEIDFYGEKVCANQFYSGSDYTAVARAWSKLARINAKSKVKAIGDFALGALSAWDASEGFDFSYVENIGEKAFWYSGINADLNFPSCTACGADAFNSSGVTRLTMQKLGLVANNMCAGCAALQLAHFPAATIVGTYSAKCFSGCTALESAEFGSVGTAVTALRPDVFTNCTQTNLTITIFTSGGRVDDLLANARNGATAAAIIIKAAEDTEYNGTAFAVGDDIITSTVEVEE